MATLHAVFVGRPVLWGLTVGGTSGAARVLEILHEELLTVMQLCGVSSISGITPSSVRDKEARR